MWCDHTFSQRNRTTRRTVEVEVGGDREVRERGLDNYVKRLKISHHPL